jgi:hypothetical protein
LFIFFFAVSEAQSPDTLSVVSWNIEWFGSPSNGPSNDNLQETNVIKVLRYLKADIYGLCEVVDTVRLRRVTDSLGSKYNFFISSFGSTAPSPSSPNWSTAQKLAFIYRKDVFSNIQTRAMLNNGSNAYYNFASGRYPYLFNANVSKNGKKRNINFILLHAKSGATTTDYTRRRDAARELKDTLDADFSNRPLVLMGDFNDELEGSIVTGYISPYDIIVKDSVKSATNYYNPISLIPERAGERSTISYSNVIDHQVINKRMDSMYIRESVDIRQDVINSVPDYLSRTTSDHYPVSSQYLLVNGDTSAVVVNPPPPPPPTALFTGFKLWPTPFQQSLVFRSGKTLTNARISLYNSMGQKVWEVNYGMVTGQSFNEVQLPLLSAGVYIFVLKSSQQTITTRLLR